MDINYQKRKSICNDILSKMNIKEDIINDCEMPINEVIESLMIDFDYNIDFARHLSSSLIISIYYLDDYDVNFDILLFDKEKKQFEYVSQYLGEEEKNAGYDNNNLYDTIFHYPFDENENNKIFHTKNVKDLYRHLSDVNGWGNYGDKELIKKFIRKYSKELQ